MFVGVCVAVCVCLLWKGRQTNQSTHPLQPINHHTYREEEHQPPSPQHHPGLASLPSLRTVLYHGGESSQSLLAAASGDDDAHPAHAAAPVAATPPPPQQQQGGGDAAAAAAAAAAATGPGTGRGLKSGTSSEASSPASFPASPRPDDDAAAEQPGAAPLAAALRMPDAVVLFYPVLNFSLSPSPSRVGVLI